MTVVTQHLCCLQSRWHKDGVSATAQRYLTVYRAQA